MRNTFSSTLATIILTILAFFFTSFSLIQPYVVQIVALFLLFTLAYFLYLIIKGTAATSVLRKYLLIFDILLLVGITGWFYSPLFYTVYFIALYFGIYHSPKSFFAFILTITILFIFNLDTTNILYNILVLISFASLIPLMYNLRRKLVK